VGILVFTSLILLAAAIIAIGGKTGFFFARASYFARFANSYGIIEGNQVRLAGVTVGTVRRVEVPREPGQDLTLTFDIEKRYQHMVRTDSRVEIKTIGLLGDKYLEVSPGSPGAPILPSGQEIPAFRGAELDKILANSGDLVDNVVAITKSLKVVLGRTERGEGMLGELTSPSESGKELSRSLRQTLDSANLLIQEIRGGKGLVGRLVSDEKLGNQISGELGSAVASLHRILAHVEGGVEGGEGLVSALLTDPRGKKKFFDMVDSLNGAAEGLAAFSRDLESGEGVVPKLVKDAQFSREFLGDLQALSKHLASVAAKLDEGNGTAARLVNDPSLFEALDDVVVGIDESKLLRWLVRNRQRSGIRKRYDKEHGSSPPPTTASTAP
jgi:phospholipid/cholesterol/gamma-HCH transport system substrate-binding protein